MELGGDDVNVIPSHGLLMEWFIVIPTDLGKPNDDFHDWIHEKSPFMIIHHTNPQ
jgi:hypothetical protein